jgi:radical SAM protein with 4Fe4S-binding SPASM domain
MLKEVKIELTNRCARNCKHCSSSATNSSKNIKNLDFENVKRIIHDAKDMNVETIVFTGGEPLMYDRLPELINLTSILGMKSTIYTFAYRTDETLNKYRNLIDLGLNKIVYSLADSLSDEEDISIYSHIEFFDKVFNGTNGKLGFHYTISKDSINMMKQIVTNTLNSFDNKQYFDKVSLLRFVPHGKGITEMDLTKEELLTIKDLYLSLKDKSKLRLGSPWNILGIENSPCIIADEIMIIGFDGIAYPCDSIKYFTKLGISGNIRENSLEEMYNSEYFSNIRMLNVDNTCSACKDYQICKSGCIGQKIIANYTEDVDKVKVLKKCINSKDPKCMR